MDSARKIASDDELRSLAAAGTGFIVDPFSRRWHVAACPNVQKMTIGEPKWFARSAAELDGYLQSRLARYPDAKPIRACATCDGRGQLAPTADGGSAARGQRVDLSAGLVADVRSAIRLVVSDPEPGERSSPGRVANLLKDVLPDAPGLSRLLVAATEERVGEQLREHVASGMDNGTAIGLVASKFASRALYDQETCAWLIGEIAAVLGLVITDTGYTPTVVAEPSVETWPAQPWSAPTRQVPPPEAGDGPARAMLDMLKARGDAPSLQAIYDGLRELGFVPHPPTVRRPGNEQKRYLRWTDPARGGPAVIYFEKASLWFVREEDLDELGDLPAGTTTRDGRQHNVWFPVSPQALDQILQGARRVKR